MQLSRPFFNLNRNNNKVSSMIYLLITTCIENRIGMQEPEKRKTEYLSAIAETLSHLPPQIIPIIVENNGQRVTYLDNFVHNGTPVSVLYTNNNRKIYSTKGMLELFDIKDTIRHFGIHDTDIIIKVTGRYAVQSSRFFTQVLSYPEVDAFVKFYGVCSHMFEYHESVLGLYAVRASLLLSWSHLTMNYHSAETAFAIHIRKNAKQIHEIQWLDLECTFAEDGRKLRV
jgi:hypothetical protein